MQPHPSYGYHSSWFDSLDNYNQLRQLTRADDHQETDTHQHYGSSSEYADHSVSTYQHQAAPPPSPRNLQIVYPEGSNTAGTCGVAVIATAAHKSWNEAMQVAQRHGLTHEYGMHWRDIYDSLKELGLKCSYHKHAPGQWKKLPDLALVTVMSQGDRHAVVFERINKQGYIYDCNQPHPVKANDYILVSEDPYIKIRG